MKILFCGLSALLVLSCGKKPSVSQQLENSLTLPEFPAQGGGVFLADGEKKVFDGSMLVWDSNASRDQILKISTLSDETKLAQGRAIEFYQSFGPNLIDLKELGEKSDQLESEAAAHLAGRRIAYARRQVPVLKQQAAAWFSSEMDRFVASGLITEEDRVSTESRFASYCEAKLWEFAVSPYLNSFAYFARPTPNPICEPVYEARGLLLPTAPACSNPRSRQVSKDYFECFWVEGVMKSDFWLKKYSDPEQAQAVAALTDHLRNGGLKSQVLSGQAKSFLVRGTLEFNGITLKSNSAEYGDLKKKKLGKWIETYEGKAGSTGASDPANPDLWLFKTATDHSEFAKVRKLIAVLGTRDYTERSVGAQDLIYNAPVADGLMQSDKIIIDGDRDRILSPANRDMGMREYPELFGESDPALTDIAPKYKKRIAEIAAQRNKILAENAGWLVHDDELNTLTEQSFQAASEPGAVAELWSSAISVTRIGSSYQVVLGLGPLTGSNLGTVYGCADVATGQSARCSDEIPGLELADVAYSPESGRFTIKAVAGQGTKLALDLVGGTNESLSQLNYDRDVVGKTLEVTLDPTVVSGLNFYTGGLKLSGGEGAALIGSVNFSSYNATLDSLTAKFGSF